MTLLLAQDLGSNRNAIIARALISASKNGHLEVIKVLYGVGSNVTDVRYNLSDIIFYASKRGHVDVVDWCLTCQPDQPYINELLNFAIKENQTEVVKYFLEKKYRLVTGKTVDSQFTSPNADSLDLATAHNAFQSMYGLLKHQPELIQCKKGQYTPLHRAAERGFIESIHVLVKYGADLKAKDRDDRMPVWFALQGKRFDVVPSLIRWDLKALYESFGRLEGVKLVNFVTLFKSTHEKVSQGWVKYVDKDMQPLFLPYLINEQLRSHIQTYLNYQLRRYMLERLLNSMPQHIDQFQVLKGRNQQLLDVGMQLLDGKNSEVLKLVEISTSHSSQPSFFAQMPIEIQSNIAYISGLPSIWTPHRFQAYQPREVVEPFMISLLEAFAYLKVLNAPLSDAQTPKRIPHHEEHKRVSPSVM